MCKVVANRLRPYLDSIGGAAFSARPGPPQWALPLLFRPLRPNAHFVGVKAAASLAVAHRHLITDSDEIGESDLTALRGRGGAGAHGDDLGLRIDGERLFERSAAGLARDDERRSRDRIDRAVRRFRAFTGHRPAAGRTDSPRSEEHTSELQSQSNLVCRLLLEKKNTY